jgi:hypothetical protein
MTDDPRKASSMNAWWPKVEGLDVLTPATQVIPLRSYDDATEIYEGVPMSIVDLDTVADAIDAVGGPPAFLRTDQSSAKHKMASASRVTSTDPEELEDSVLNLLRHNELRGFAGLPWTTLYVREWLDLKHEFTAFEETPIASEVRFFIHDGLVHGFGFYWPQEAIAEHPATGNIRGDWRVLLDQVRTHAESEAVNTVWPMAREVADAFDGYWSVDFAETEDGDWYLIDMALGQVSWHPEGVERPEEFTE